MADLSLFRGTPNCNLDVYHVYRLTLGATITSQHGQNLQAEARNSFVPINSCVFFQAERMEKFHPRSKTPKSLGLPIQNTHHYAPKCCGPKQKPTFQPCGTVCLAGLCQCCCLFPVFIERKDTISQSHEMTNPLPTSPKKTSLPYFP